MEYNFKSTLNILVAVAMFFNYSGFSYAVDLPQVSTVVAGTADFSTVGNTMNITASDRAIINYNQFNIGAQNTVNFIQPSSTAVALNRVIGAQASSIYGALNANGRIFLVNPNGILFAPGSRVDAAGLIASTMGISNANFLNGNYSFERNGANGSVNNQGQIMIRNGGYLGLFAPEVRNSGSVLADMGTVMLASGEAATVNLDDNADVSVVVDPGQVTGITNSGTIRADGGKVLLTAKSLNTIFDNAINNTGLIQANSLEGKNGEIYLTANGRVDLAGTVNAQGGEVTVNAAGADLSGIMRANEINITANSQALHLGDVINSGSVTISDVGDIFFDGNYILQSGNLTINAGTGPVPSGESGNVYQATGKTIAVYGDLTITAMGAVLENIISGNDISISVTNAVALNGLMIANHDVSITAGSIAVNSDIVARNNISLNAVGDVVQAGTSEMIAGNDVSISGNDLTLNDIYFGGDFLASADGAINIIGMIKSSEMIFKETNAVVTTTSTQIFGTDGVIIATNNGNGFGLTFDPFAYIPEDVSTVSAQIHYYSDGLWKVYELSAAQLGELQASLADNVTYHFNGQPYDIHGYLGTEFDPYLVVTAIVTTTIETAVSTIIPVLIGGKAGTINLNAQDDVTFLAGGSAQTEGVVNITSTGGAIVNSAVPGELNIVAGDASLVAATGIGSGNALVTDIDNLAAKNTTSGDIVIDNTGDLSIADLNGFGGLINTANGGALELTTDGNLTIDAAVETNAGDIDLAATGNIAQNADVTIHQTDAALLNAPTNVESTSHPINVWEAGASNQQDVDIQWQLPESILERADYTAIAEGSYTMDAGAEINTNGGDATITANDDIALALVNAGTGNIAVTSDAGSISGDLVGRTAQLSAPLGSTASIDFSAPDIGFSYLWQNDATPSDPDVIAEPAITPVLEGGNWIYKKTLTAIEDSMTWNFRIATVDGVESSAVVVLGDFYIDTQAPVIAQGLVTGTAGNAGWYRSEVSVAFDATDNLSGIFTPGNLSVTGFDSQEISIEGIHQTVTSAVACDMAGNCTATGLTSSMFNIDWTAPTLNWGDLSTAPNTAGWNNADVTLPYTTGDNISGVSSSTPGSPLSFTTEGTGLTQDVIVIDVAGNSATFTSPAVNLDKTAPIVSALITGGMAGSNGWYTSDVTSTGSATDSLSGVALFEYSTNGGSIWTTTTNPKDVLTSVEGTGLSVMFRATDAAGLTNTASTSFKIDKSAPIVSALITGGTAGDNGWYVSDVTSTGSATDGVSGVSLFEYSTNGGSTWTTTTNPKDVLTSLEGTGLSVTFRATNGAGLTNTASTSFKIDKTAPEITQGAVTGTEGNNGWYRSEVTVAFDATDNLSGVATSGALSVTGFDSQVISTEGVDQTVTSAVACDMAGNCTETGLASSIFDIDWTAPVITVGSETGTQNPDGSWLQDVTVTFDATDNLSGFAPNPNPWTGFSSGSTTGTGAAVPVTSGPVTDLAGNTAPGITSTYNVVSDDPTPDPELLTADFLQQRFIYPHTERLAEKLVNPMDMITSAGLLITGQVFFYHPLTKVDDGSYNGFQLEEAAYDFIDGQIEPCDPTGKSGKPCRNK